MYPFAFLYLRVSISSIVDFSKLTLWKFSILDLFYGCINIKRAEGTNMTDNVIAGCAQAGLLTSGNHLFCFELSQIFGQALLISEN